MTSVAKNTRRFMKLSYEDGFWLDTQPISVNILWRHAAMSDPWGEKWQTLDTDLAGSTFRAARKKIEEYGAFVFRVKPNNRDRRRTEEWEVLNLHGASVQSYWELPAKNSAPKSKASTAQNADNLSAENSASISQIPAENSAPIDENSAGNLSETLSLVQPCSSLRSNSDLIKDLGIENENLSTETRSGRLELEASTKVAASAPSPAASIVEKKSFATSQDLGSSKDPESDEEDPDLFASAHGLRHAEDLGSTEPSRSSSQQKSITSTECLSVGGDNKIPLAPHTVLPQSDTQPHHDASDTALAEPTVESGTPPLETVSEAHTASNDDPFLAIYHEACCRYNERGLKLQDSDERWAEFYLAGSKGLLYPIKEGFKANGLEHALQMLPPDLLCDYLFYNSEHYSEPAICIKDDSGKLQMVFWSQLPAIVFDRPQKARN